jgi:antitoxin component of MazEF toxin-antitoxin module
MTQTSAVVRTRRVGGSLTVTIPKEVVQAAGIGDKELVRIEVRKVRKDLFGALKGIGKLEKGDRLDVHE